jgi:acyl carrier protein
MTSATFERVRGIAADVLKVSADQISQHSSPETLATWDSVQHLNLVLALEQEFAVQFEPEEMDEMLSIGQIVSALERKLAKAAWALAELPDMTLQFAPAQPSEQSEIIAFLLRSFSADPQLTSFLPEVIQWKYFSSHPDWEGSRSFVMRKDGEIAAHGGVWPAPRANLT